MNNIDIICIKDYLVKSFPNDYIIPKGTKCNFEGYIMGYDLTISLCPIQFPPDYDHLTKRCVTLFDKKTIKKHFKIIKKDKKQ